MTEQIGSDEPRERENERLRRRVMELEARLADAVAQGTHQEAPPGAPPAPGNPTPEPKERAHDPDLMRVNALLASICSVNQILVRERDPTRLIGEACAALVRRGAYSHAWSLLTDERHAVEHAAYASFEGEPTPLTLTKQSGMPRCLEAGDHADLISGDPLRRLCERCPVDPTCPPGTRMVLRLQGDGRCRGLLGVSFNDLTTPTTEQRALFSELAADINLALASIEDQDRRRRAERLMEVQLLDVTERQQAEERLRAERQRLFNVLETLPTMISLLTEDHHVAFANRNFRERFGESHGRHCYEYCFGGTEPCDFCECYRVLETGRPHRWEVALPDGSIIEAHDLAFTDVDGSRMVLEMAIDVTEQRRMERALRDSEEKYRKLAQDAAAMVYSSDPETLRTTYTNDVVKRLFGYSSQEWLADPDLWERIIHPDDRQRVLDVFAEHRESRRPGTVQYRVTTKRETTCWCENAFSWSTDRDGRLTALNGIVLDITERRGAEEERDRTMTALAQADRLATMGLLAAGVAHEINNPLAHVLVNLEGLEQDFPLLQRLLKHAPAAHTEGVGAHGAVEAASAVQRDLGAEMLEDGLELIREALSATRRIKTIAHSLGTFSRVEHDELSPLDVQTCVEHAITLAANEVRFRARLVRDFSPVPLVVASEGKLAQVFLNLLLNGAHALNEGHVDQNELRVRTWSEGEEVFVEITDTGKGIAPEHRARIFEPFFSTNPDGLGSGLGLSISKKLVTDLGGDISFTSELGKGTRFLVRLPRLPRDGNEGQKAAPDAPPPDFAIRSRLLVVDDEPGLRRAMSRILQTQHEVLTASSGSEARALLEADQRFDLILCDLMMPEMSGMELHAWLASRAPQLAERLVFVTAGAFTPDASKYLAKVGNARLEKPFETTAFRKRINELLLAARAKGRA